MNKLSIKNLCLYLYLFLYLYLYLYLSLYLHQYLYLYHTLLLMPLPLQPRGAVVQAVHLLDAQDAVDAVAAAVGHMLLIGRRQHRGSARRVARVRYYLGDKGGNKYLQRCRRII